MGDPSPVKGLEKVVERLKVPLGPVILYWNLLTQQRLLHLLTLLTTEESGALYYITGLARSPSPRLIAGPKRKPQQTFHSCRMSVSRSRDTISKVSPAVQ